MAMSEEGLCPLFYLDRLGFCGRCPVSREAISSDEAYAVAVDRCMQVMDAALEEVGANPPTNIETTAAEIILRIDRILNSGFRYSEETMATVMRSLERFPDMEKSFKAKRSKLDVEIGNLYFALKDYPKAMEWYDKATVADANNKDGWNNKGVSLARTGKLDAAIKFYDLALKIDLRYEQAWFNKGKALYKTEKYKDAIVCFDKVTEINPFHLSAWNNKGVLYKALGKNKEAMTCYEKAIEIRNDYEWAWYNKGMLLASMNSFDEALKCFDRVLEINPNFKPAKEGKEMFGKMAGKKKLFSFKKK